KIRWLNGSSDSYIYTGSVNRSGKYFLTDRHYAVAGFFYALHILISNLSQIMRVALMLLFVICANYLWLLMQPLIKQIKKG
ncbi:hypothetical protein, partial [Rheinheimera baltica]|uniref:hypothetical protein n=1 Tax=Rheinheimera baltica TaxID=67576 RepID=UPI0027400C50